MNNVIQTKIKIDYYEFRHGPIQLVMIWFYHVLPRSFASFSGHLDIQSLVPIWSSMWRCFQVTATHPAQHRYSATGAVTICHVTSRGFGGIWSYRATWMEFHPRAMRTAQDCIEIEMYWESMKHVNCREQHRIASCLMLRKLNMLNMLNIEHVEPELLGKHHRTS